MTSGECVGIIMSQNRANSDVQHPIKFWVRGVEEN
jgi:hypothetical protein